MEKIGISHVNALFNTSHSEKCEKESAPLDLYIIKVNFESFTNLDSVIITAIDYDGASYFTHFPLHLIERLFYVSATEENIQNFMRNEIFFMSYIEEVFTIGREKMYRNIKLTSPAEINEFYNGEKKELLNAYVFQVKEKREYLLNFLAENSAFFKVYPWLIRKSRLNQVYDIIKPLFIEEYRRQVPEDEDQSLTFMGWVQTCACMWFKVNPMEYPSFSTFKTMLRENVFPSYAPFKVYKNNHREDVPAFRLMTYDLEVMHSKNDTDFPIIVNHSDIIAIAAIINEYKEEKECLILYIQPDNEEISNEIAHQVFKKISFIETKIECHVTVMDCVDEEALLTKFLEYIRNAHLLSGWGISNFDAKWILFKSFFLLEMSQDLPISLLFQSSQFFFQAVDDEFFKQPFSEPALSIYNYTVSQNDGKINHYKLCFPHQLHIDGILCAMKFISATSSFSLNAVSGNLGLGQKEDVDVVLLNNTFVSLYNDKNPQERKNEIRKWIDGIIYCAIDALLAHKIIKTQIIFLMNSLMLLADTNIEEVVQSSARLPHVLDAIVHMFYERHSPPTFDIQKSHFGHTLSIKKTNKYAGAKVLEVSKDLIIGSGVETDVKSLYPSVARQFNLCASTTFILPPGTSIPVWLQNEVSNFRVIEIYEANNVDPIGRIFSLKEVKNYTPIVVDYFRHKLDLRSEVKNEMKGIKKKMAQDKNDKNLPIKYTILDNAQLALKLTANGAYGLFGDLDSIFYNICIAAGITHYGYKILEFLEETSVTIAKNLFLERYISTEQAIASKAVLPLPCDWFNIENHHYGERPCNFSIVCGDTDSIFCFGNFLMKQEDLSSFYIEFNDRLNQALIDHYSHLIQVESGGEFDVLCNTVKKRYFLISRTGLEKTRGIQKCDKLLKKAVIKVYIALGLYSVLYKVQQDVNRIFFLTHPVFIDFVTYSLKHLPDVDSEKIFIENENGEKKIEAEYFAEITKYSLNEYLVQSLSNLLRETFTNFDYSCLHVKVKNLLTYKQPPAFAIYAFIEDIEGAGFNYVRSALKDTNACLYDTICCKKRFKEQDCFVDASKLLNAFMHFEDYLEIVSKSPQNLSSITHSIPYMLGEKNRTRMFEEMISKKPALKIYATELNFISEYSLCLNYGIILNPLISKISNAKFQRILRVVHSHKTHARFPIEALFTDKGDLVVSGRYWEENYALMFLKRKHVAFQISAETNQAIKYIIFFILKVIKKNFDITPLANHLQNNPLSLIVLDFGTFLFKNNEFITYFTSVSSCYNSLMSAK